MTPIERSAQALQDALPDTTELAERGLYPTDLAAGVRAVLTAIREPSEAVLQAMRDTVPVNGYEWDYVQEDAVQHWEAMIDAVLSDTP